MPEQNDQSQPADQPQPDSSLPYQDDLKGRRLERRALRSRWNVPDKYREALMKKVVRDGLDPSASKRDAVSAMRAILSAEQQDYEKDRADELLEAANLDKAGQLPGGTMSDEKRLEHVSELLGKLLPQAAPHKTNGTR